MMFSGQAHSQELTIGRGVVRQPTKSQTNWESSLASTQGVPLGRFLGWKFPQNSDRRAFNWDRLNRDRLITDSATTWSPAPVAVPALSGSLPDAGFSVRPTLPAGFIPTGVASGDFNEDGHMDLAISNGGDNTVFVLLGNGDGTFKVPKILYTRGLSPDWITVVKLNNSGHLDIAITDGDSNLVEIFSAP
jgi:hypothetical protein